MRSLMWLAIPSFSKRERQGGLVILGLETAHEHSRQLTGDFRAMMSSGAHAKTVYTTEHVLSPSSLLYSMPSCLHASISRTDLAVRAMLILLRIDAKITIPCMTRLVQAYGRIPHASYTPCMKANGSLHSRNLSDVIVSRLLVSLA